MVFEEFVNQYFRRTSSDDSKVRKVLIYFFMLKKTRNILLLCILKPRLKDIGNIYKSLA
jgi:hypothetical protein